MSPDEDDPDFDEEDVTDLARVVLSMEPAVNGEPRDKKGINSFGVG